MKNAVFWDVTLCGSCVPTSQILVILTMEAIRSSETSVVTRATQSYISEGGILHIIPSSEFYLGEIRKMESLLL
jgi:hypothetical protein